MNILVIGNGFDLAHGLPTKYGDFLQWIVDQMYYYDYLNEEGAEIIKGVSRPNLHVSKSKFREKHSTRSVKQHEIWKCMDENFWLEYFLNNDLYQKENWIDFENEIKKVIQLLDSDMFVEKLKHELDDNVDKSSSIFFKNVYVKRAIEISTSSIITYRQIRDKLRMDLNKLIRALEIYLSDFVGKLECTMISPDIEKVMTYSLGGVDGSVENKISYVISFNYTNTYKRIYFREENIDNYIHYVHGLAIINHDMECNNMVLGIDEFLPDNRKDKDIELIAFKKFYQRICKETGSNYKEWVNEIQNDYETNDDTERNSVKMIKYALTENDIRRAIKWLKLAHKNYEKKIEKHNLYIFGHSLDVTDKDILRELILCHNINTAVFYRNQEQKEQQIANLVKIIGQDELIRRTGGSTKTIEFKLQQPMIPINNES